MDERKLAHVKFSCIGQMHLLAPDTEPGQVLVLDADLPRGPEMIPLLGELNRGLNAYAREQGLGIRVIAVPSWCQWRIAKWDDLMPPDPFTADGGNPAG